MVDMFTGLVWKKIYGFKSAIWSSVFDLSVYERRKISKLGRDGSLYQSTRQKNPPPTTHKPVFSQDQLAQGFHSVTRNANLTSASSKPSGTQDLFSS
jgi:hypothetical protein